MKVALIGDSLTEGRPGVSFVNILKEKFPSDSFVKLGKPGASVKSLYSRLIKTGLDADFDVSFLWIGTNDVYSKLLKIQAQPVAENHDEFIELYEQVLKIVMPSTKKVVTVSPSIVGEHIENQTNKEIKELSVLIQSLSEKELIDYMNLQTIFEKELANRNSSTYISTNPFRVMFDVFFYKSEARIDRLSNERGLKLTLDGIHLNSTGARIVADEYATVIRSTLVDSSIMEVS